MAHPWDYVAHFIVSSAGVGILFLVLFFPLKALGIHPKAAIFVSAAIMLVIGIVKEISDKNLGKQDMAGDMLADFLGITLTVIVIFLAMRLITSPNPLLR